jgi:orotate phosphoribosyltransferase
MAREVARLAPNVVVGPTTGGVMLAFETARHLSAILGWEVRGLFAEPSVLAGGRELRRGFEVSRADTIVLVDDILTTGASLRETAEAVRHAGGQAIAAVVMVDRSSEVIDIGMPVHAVGRIIIPTWPPASCPLCDAGDWLETPGSAGAT